MFVISVGPTNYVGEVQGVYIISQPSKSRLCGVTLAGDEVTLFDGPNHEADSLLGIVVARVRKATEESITPEAPALVSKVFLDVGKELAALRNPAPGFAGNRFAASDPPSDSSGESLPEILGGAE